MVKPGQARLVRHELDNGHRLFAGRRKFRPIASDWGVEIHLSLVDEHGQTNGCDSLRHRVDQLHRVMRVWASVDLGTTREIDDAFAPAEDRDGRPNVVTNVEVADQSLFDGAELRMTIAGHFRRGSEGRSSSLTAER